MIIYFSGGGVRGVWQRVNELLLRRGAARLLSFAYRPLLEQYCTLVRECGVRAQVMVDSGAFTAWSKGDAVDLEELSDCFAALNDNFSDCCDFVMINLDVIPGRKGVDPTRAELIEAQAQSELNFKILNLRFPEQVLPVFHQGEGLPYFQELVARNEYVCLSPRNDLAEKWRIEWARLYANRATCKYHGLAATGIDMMETVPWYSVDSATWVMVGGYGGIFLREGHKLSILAVSSKSSAIKEDSKHINSLRSRPLYYDAVIAQIEAKGYALERLQTGDLDRCMWNAEAWMDLQLRSRPTAAAGVLFDA